MSNVLSRAAGAARCVARPCPAVDLLLEPRVVDLGSFSVRRLLPARERTLVGPFLFFDHFGPARFPPGEGMDVRPHPHINLATVTYLFDGEVLHRDNLGSVQRIRPGEVNWMTAGSGVVHSERTPPDVRAREHGLHGLQLWAALPLEHEETAPTFRHHGPDDLPRVEGDGVSVRVLLGEAFGARSEVCTFSPTLYAEARLEAGATLRLPSEVAERAVYVVSGGVGAEGCAVGEHAMAVFAPGAAVRLTAAEDTRLVVVGGAPLGERHVWWNYVSSRRERIEQAKRDWTEGRFAPVPGETEFIPLPEA